ncbi:hypothetical protein CCH79_00010330 [Gambusia affinis]|uniref:Immunoglobulin V-set domain-containing protein n=1 Tax=Gambusia affinis TaxID=33528 RepID=A0A315VGP0_GAMAF|nr:hypothetical protein CCH79_00010330 [Gambusia affinis]
MPAQWQVSDGKALCPEETLRPVSLAPSLSSGTSLSHRSFFHPLCLPPSCYFVKSPENIINEISQPCHLWFSATTGEEENSPTFIHSDAAAVCGGEGRGKHSAQLLCPGKPKTNDQLAQRRGGACNQLKILGCRLSLRRFFTFLHVTDIPVGCREHTLLASPHGTHCTRIDINTWKTKKKLDGVSFVSDLKVHDGSLTILGITRDDRGAYTCRAYSDQGEVLHTTRLLVQGKASRTAAGVVDQSIPDRVIRL